MLLARPADADDPDAERALSGRRRHGGTARGWRSPRPGYKARGRLSPRESRPGTRGGRSRRRARGAARRSASVSDALGGGEPGAGRARAGCARRRAGVCRPPSAARGHDAGPARLEHEPVGVEQERHRGRVVGLVGLEQAAVAPLVRAEPAGQDDGPQHDDPAAGRRAGDDGHVERGRHVDPQPPRGRAPAAAASAAMRSRGRAAAGGRRARAGSRRAARGASARCSGAPVLDEQRLVEARRRVGARHRPRPAARDARQGAGAAVASGSAAPIGGEQRRGLGRRLARLGGALGVGHHAAAHAEPDAVARHLERADRDAELEPGERARQADGARVGLPARCSRAPR